MTLFGEYTLYALGWDALIACCILGPAALQYVLLTRYLRDAHGQVRWQILPLFGVLDLLILAVVYGSFIEPRQLTVSEFEVTLPVQEEMTIAVAADFHLGPYKGAQYMQRVADAIQTIDPDIVLLPGDFTYGSQSSLDALKPLADLQPRYGMFAVLGNHAWGVGKRYMLFYEEGPDESLRIQRGLERLGITVLRNSWSEIQTDTGLLFVAGVDDPYSGQDDIEAALPPIQRKSPIILLSHSPDIILQNQSRYPHLIVSGHTHGGQIRLPFIGPLVSLPTQLGNAYDQGIFSVDDNTTLAITRGAGESGARARLFAPPEIMVLNVQPE